MYEPLLFTYATRPAAPPPSICITCPAALKATLEANHLRPREDTIADGGCGYHAFALSVLDCRDERIAPAEIRKLRRLYGAAALVKHLRSAALSWLRAHADDDAWADMSLSSLAVAMSSDVETWRDYLAKHAEPHAWADACIIHALACVFDVDCLVWQVCMDPAIVGASLLPHNTNASVPLVSVAMQNDRHFWGTSVDRLDVVPVDGTDWAIPQPAPGDPLPRIAGGELGPDADGCENPNLALNIVSVQPDVLPSHIVDAEIALCETLASWDPWALPSEGANPTLMFALEALSGSNPATMVRCMVREQTFLDLAYEHEHFEQMSARMRTNRCSRTSHWRMQKQCVSCPRGECVAVQRETKNSLDLPSIQKQLDVPCWDNESPHSCLQIFQEHPSAIRNWRLLWFSLPKCTRKELLMKMHAAAPRYNRGKAYCVMGIRVCRNAFCQATEITRWQLSTASKAVAAGHVTSMSTLELPPSMRRPLGWFDVRGWLEAI